MDYRTKKINEINQHYIDINYIPIMTNQEKITLMLKNHPDYLNHVTGFNYFNYIKNLNKNLK